MAQAAAAAKKAVTATPKATPKTTTVTVSNKVSNSVKNVSAATVAAKTAKPQNTTTKTSAATGTAVNKVITTGAKVAGTVKQNTAVKQPVQTVKTGTASTAKSTTGAVSGLATTVKQKTTATKTTAKLTAIGVTAGVSQAVKNVSKTVPVSSGVANTTKNVLQKVAESNHGSGGKKRDAITTKEEETTLDKIQTTLDVAGMAPFIGEPIDAVNGVIYLARGDYLNASLSLMAMIPFIGTGSTASKLAVKGAKAIDKAKDTEKVIDVAKDVAKQVDNVKDAAKQADNIKDVAKQGDNVADATKQVNVGKGESTLKIEEVVPSGSTHPVKVYTDGNAQINIGKIDTYIRGKVELDVEATTTRIDELKDLRKSNPENFTKEMKKELQECEDKLHNYQRSQEMSNTLNTAGIEDTIENNQMIVENLYDAAKKVTEENTEIISYIEGVNGKVQVVSRWKILPDGTPYLATVILKPVK